MTKEGSPSPGKSLAKSTAKTAVKKSAAAPKKAAGKPRQKRPERHFEELTTYQRNELFRIMQRAELNPAGYQWTSRTVDNPDGTKEFYPSLEHQSEKLMFFAVGMEPLGSGEFSVFFALAKHQRSRWSDDLEYWEEVTPCFNEWIEASKQQLKGDMWEKLDTQRAMFSAVVSSGENSPLSDAEQKHLNASIDELLARVKEQGLFDREQYRQLESALTHQQKATGWLGRVDWVNGFMGAVFGQVLTIASNSKAVEQFLTLAAAAVSWLHGHLPQLAGKQHLMR